MHCKSRTADSVLYVVELTYHLRLDTPILYMF